MLVPTDPEIVRSIFDSAPELTIGIEEEVLLLDPATHRLRPEAAAVTARAADPAIKAELPASQVELVTRPHPDLDGSLDDLRRARRRLVEVCGDEIRPAAAAVHPFESIGAVSEAAHHRVVVDRHGEIARRQIVGALQIHVAVGSADRSLAVYNALRSHLPDLAALGAAAPFHEGRDVGLASVRPLVAGQLPRQGIPPAFTDWDHFAAEMAWGRAAGALPSFGSWWWELRPHVGFGTLEIRVPDAQPSLDAVDAVVRVAYGLVADLADRHRGGRPLPLAPTWRIEENRWRALRDGVHGELLDLDTGDVVPTARRLHRLFDRIEEHVPGGLDSARRLVARPTVDQLRRVGCEGASAYLADRFPPDAG